MNFYDDKAAVTGIADFIIRAGLSMYNALKYVYAMAERDFYAVSIKDVFKVILNNVTDADALKVLGLKNEGADAAEMETDSYKAILPVMVYSLAVRTPTLKNIGVGDDLIYSIYSTVCAKGAENIGEYIAETYLELKYLVRKAKPLPSFTADWYKNFIYERCPGLSAITNKNIFLLGVADIFFAMFYACYEEALHLKVEEYSN